jgi:hypothetical protein
VNEEHYPHFEKAITQMFGAFGRNCAEHHVKGYWSVLRNFTLQQVREAAEGCRDPEAKSPPTAAKLAWWLKQRDRPEEGVRDETRDYHYVRPGDVMCRRCLRPTKDIPLREIWRAGGRGMDFVFDETCPPAGFRLRQVVPPEGGEAEWYRQREAEERGDG